MNYQEEVANFRKDYQRAALQKSQMPALPMEAFEQWFAAAVKSPIQEANAMLVASATPAGKPSLRTVLLKAFDERGFVFYTNYDSRKGQELTENPSVSLLFFWDILEQQIRIEGMAERLSAEESAIYFAKRPRASQLGAWVSPQSQKIENRATLDARKDEIDQQFSDTKQIPLPENWGGFLIRPYYFEFWQGRSSRLHDRICYEKQTNNNWSKFRIAP